LNHKLKQLTDSKEVCKGDTVINKIQLDNPWVGIFVIIVVIILSLVLQQQIQARFDKRKLEICHEVGGYYMSAVGTLYAIILGLVVNDASVKYDDARKYIEQETNALVQVYAGANSLSEASKMSIRGKINDYVRDVINVEWDKMALREASITTVTIFTSLTKEIGLIEPVTENQKAIYPRILDSIVSAAENRRGRIYINDYGMQSVEWISMIIGGVITISFTMFFIIDNIVAQKIMTIMISLILSMNLYIAYLLNNPFSGGLRLPDLYFVKLMETFTRY
jgi:hypothetical protein